MLKLASKKQGLAYNIAFTMGAQGYTVTNLSVVWHGWFEITMLKYPQGPGFHLSVCELSVYKYLMYASYFGLKNLPSEESEGSQLQQKSNL